jgi:polyprenyl-phospho-N-acetylgalactosaminyl synthase
MNRDVCVIVPVYNEVTVVGSVIEGLNQYFQNIVCIDDGSRDGTEQVIKPSGAVLLRHRRNKGQGAALRTGLHWALAQKRFRYFVTFDADGQHNPVDAARLVEHARQQKVDVVLGSRFLGEAINMPVMKRIVLKIAIWVSNRTTGVQLTDTHNGLRVFHRRFAEKLHLRCNGMAHASEIIYRLAAEGNSYAELPVTIVYNDYSLAKGQPILNAFSIAKEYVKYRLDENG